MKSGMFNMIFKNRIHSDIVTEMGVPVYILLLQVINTLKTLTRIIANTGNHELYYDWKYKTVLRLLPEMTDNEQIDPFLLEVSSYV